MSRAIRLYRYHDRTARWLAVGFFACACIAAAFAFVIRQSSHGESTQIDTHKRSAVLAQKLQGDFIQMLAEADTLVSVLKKDRAVSFQKLMGIGPNPAYLFQDTSLVYWNHFDKVPTARQLKGGGCRIVKDAAGLTLVVVRPFSISEKPWSAVVCKPLQRTYPVTNAYLKPGWIGDDLSGVRFAADSTHAGMAWIHLPDGSRISALEVPHTARYIVQAFELRVLVAGCLALLFMLLSAIVLVRMLAARRHHLWAIAAWGIALMLLKAGISLPGIRNGLDELALFSPRLYASSTIAPSLGDLLLTTLILAAFSWLVFRYAFRIGWVAFLKGKEFWVAASASLLYLLLLLGAYRVMRSLYLHSQTVLDVARGFRISWERLAALGIFISLAFTLFFSVHVLARILAHLWRKHTTQVLGGIALGTLLMVAIMVGFGSRAWMLEGAGVLFLLAWLKLRLPEYLFRLRYQTYFYLFSIAILSAGAATQAYVRYRDRQGYTDRLRFAQRLVAQGDQLAEYLLWESTQRMAADITLRYLLTNSADYSRAEEHLRHTYSDAYFDQYALELGVFSALGQLRAGQAEAERMTNIQRFVTGSMTRTSYPDIYFSHMPSEEVFKRYLAVVDLPALPDSAHPDLKGQMVGYVTLDLKMRRLAETSVFATLLVNGAGQDPSTSEKYSYAVFDTTGIVQQEGTFNYDRGFVPAWLEDQNPIEIIRHEGWVHAIFRQPDGQQVVVSAPDTFLRDAFTNFSFLLLVLVAFILMFVIGFTLRQQRDKRSLTFAGKIQIYLNAAFFLPLTVFGLVSFTLVELSLRADLNAGYLMRARNAAKSIEPLMAQTVAGHLSRATFGQRMDDMARFTGLNASLYSTQGRLLYSSHPLIYRKGILSPYINPDAQTQLGEEGLHETLLDERLGRLRYSSAYVAVRIPKSRRISAVLAVPFFEAGSELESQLSNAIATVVSSFTAVFIVFMVLSYFASQILVVPLKLITARLLRTTLGETEPLTWADDDEIGLLVNGYNGMLRKLEASRAALASTEKESAWREMAQQVAHEIKNPLTPMKLTVQQLQRVLSPGQEPPDETRLKRALAGLLQQVENLSDIAGSFSAFARMPQPKAELFDLARIVRRTVELHRSNTEVDVKLTLPGSPTEAFIVGDEGIFQGIITNLILNGIQAVPATKRPAIEVVLERVEDGILRLSITDNGEGIPEEIQAKVFLPNFSTKFSGSGIGLALAKRGVEYAQGRIWFETSAGTGTTFYIEVAERQNQG